MAGARHWPAHLGERPAVEAVADPELRSRLSAWAMATLALVGCDEAANVDRALVAALGMVSGAPLTGPGAADAPRTGQDSGSLTSEPIEAARGTIDDVLCGGCGEPLEARQHTREGGLWSAPCDRETCRWGWADCDYRPSVSNVLAYGDRLVSMRWVRAALERWGRRIERQREQPVMSPASRPVLPELLAWLDVQVGSRLLSPGRRAELGAMLEERTAVGVKRYKVPLHSHNRLPGRGQTGEELVDALQYETQDLMETDDLDAQAWVKDHRYKIARCVETCDGDVLRQVAALVGYEAK
jgi:hypothetical protein